MVQVGKGALNFNFPLLSRLCPAGTVSGSWNIMPSHKSQRRRGAAVVSGNPKFYGRHAVYAALDNPERKLVKLWGTREELGKIIVPDGLNVQFAEVADLARYVPKDAPHQGLVLEVAPLEDVWLTDALAVDKNDNRPLVVLDQITDPHNVGAIFRTAAAFDAVAVITQDRHAPPESGALAKAASGGLEITPWVRVVNLARALEEIAEAGYWRIGLSGHAKINLDDALTPGRNALVLGAEGDGMRRNIEEHCDTVAKLPISARMESLNVSNAAAVALYAATVRAD
jgi:23S rRNA (guanosine2251-2'-O)-methyltransferase